MSPIKRYGDLLTFEPQTTNESLLQEALRDAEIHRAYDKGVLQGQQAALIMQHVYCEKVRRQLATQEKKKNNKGKSRKLMGDGKARLLTADAFIDRVVENTLAREAEEQARGDKRATREIYHEEVKAWKKEEEARKVRNQAVKDVFKQEVKLWEAERDIQRTEKKRPRWKKPTQGPLEKAKPKPKMARKTSNIEESESGRSGSNNESGEGSSSDDDNVSH